MRIGLIGGAFLSLLLAACAAPVPREPATGHLSVENAKPAATGDIPAPVQQTLALPKPRPAAKTETYSVVVNNVDVHDLLFALARDAKLNVDIHPGIAGRVTLNALDQTLPQLLTRIAKQIDMRFELDGPNLAVMPDTPFLKHYKVDYVNMSRSVTGTVSANTQIATGTASAGGGGVGGSTFGGGNVSTTRIENVSKNQFWESLDKNIKDLLRETDKIVPENPREAAAEASAPANAAPPAGANQRLAQAIANALTPAATPESAPPAVAPPAYRTTFREAASVITNPESGIVTVRATQRQHERIQEFLDRVVNAARRQVMIEATIVEVALSDGYEQGIDWTRLIGDGTFGLSMSALNTSGSAANLTYKGNTITAGIRLLQTFGTTKVLSSPRLSVLNNQTALLKVVDNYVYFNVRADTTTAANVAQTTTFTTTPQTVSIGLVMTVTPQIGDNDVVTLNVRPTITSVSNEVEDPNPVLKDKNITNKVPAIRTREIESVMRIASGEIAVLGGLMEDGVNYKNSRVPVLGQIPVLGEAFHNRNNSATKSELVIFLRPIVVKDASLDGDYAGLRDRLPRDNFFTPPPQAQPFNLTP